VIISQYALDVTGNTLLAVYFDVFVLSIYREKIEKLSENANESEQVIRKNLVKKKKQKK
jgi:hypothetical protein